MQQNCGVSKNLNHLKFWQYIYWKHGKATLSTNLSSISTEGRTDIKATVT